MKIKFKNITDLIPIDEGSTLTENYNETLDSAVIRLSHLPSEIDIEPLDEVKLFDDNNNKIKDMCIDSYDCTQEAIGQLDTTFSYTINLFSLTKLLEGVILPNLSNTPHREGDKITVLQFVARTLSFYGPYYFEDGLIKSKWKLSNNFIDKFTNVECPEMQWSTPTFREVLTDLTMIKDCIPLLKKNNNDELVIDYLDLTATTDGSNKSFNFIRKSRSSDDYISEIKMELQNVMQTNVAGINTTVTTAEYLTFTTDESIITSENVHLKTQFPIMKINHLWIICFGLATNDSDTTIIRMDLCNFAVNWKTNPDTKTYQLIYEKKEYDSLTALYRSKIPTISTIASASSQGGEFYSSYRNFCVYFTRNSNRIEGFTDLSKALFAAERTTLEYLKLLCACYNIDQLYNNNLNFAKDINAGENSYFTTFFQIEYETTYNAVFSATKGDNPRNNKTIADNQTNAWVDAYSQGFLEYQKANRLGNLQKMYNQRVTNKSNLYVIGDKINDDIIYRTEYQFYKNHIEGNAYATKNYVLRDYFTGIKSKIRTWVNAREEAFIRHDLKKYYCEFSYNQNNDPVETVNSGKALAYYLVSALYESVSEKPVQYVLVRTRSYDSENDDYIYYPSDSAKYVLNCVARLIGNSIVFTTGFDDNWIVDKHPNVGTRDSGETYDTTGVITNDDIEPIYITTNPYAQEHYEPPHFKYSGTGIIFNDYPGITTNYYKYCDGNGEFEFIYIYFLTNLQISDHVIYQNNAAVKDLFMDYYNMPAIRDNLNNPYKFGLELEYYKDNKEKPVISTQFEFRSTETDVAFTKFFLQRQDMIRNIEKSALKYYASNTFNKAAVPNGATSMTVTLNIVSINDYCVRVSSNGDGSFGKYLYICDNDNNLILVFNQTKNLYLNIRRTL